MEKSIITLQELKGICDQCTQKFLLRLPATVKMDLKDETEEDTTENQIVLDLDLKMTSYKNNTSYKLQEL